jgi:hypothetical protein
MGRSNYLESETPQTADEHGIGTACRNVSRADVIIIGALAILGVAEYELPCYAARSLEVDVLPIARNEGEIHEFADVFEGSHWPA